MSIGQATIINRENLTNDVIELTVETNNEFNFEPGQFVTIKIDDKIPPCFRAYSIASKKLSENQFSICIKVVEDGRGSNWLNSLKEGDKFNFLGPSGKFTLENKEENILFVATGTGVAPFKSIIETELEKGNQKKIHLLFGVRHESDVFYLNLFEDLATKHPNFSFQITLSRSETEEWNGEKGRVTDVLRSLNLKGFLNSEDDSEKLKTLKETETYICGLSPMITEVTEILENFEVPAEKIHSEKYD